MSEIQLASFYIGDVLLGIDIDLVKEICRPMDMTCVPHTPACVRGVINLRGEVVTLLDLRRILGLPEQFNMTVQRNLIVNFSGEHVGFCVDVISDILTVDQAKVENPPANINGMEGRFFTGVYPLPEEIVLVLNLDEILSATMV